jgi:hypothetical protein
MTAATSPATVAAVALVALVGHAAWWIGFVNRVHATNLPRWAVDLLSYSALAVFLGIPPGFAWWAATAAPLEEGLEGWRPWPWPIVVYSGLCLAAVAGFVIGCAGRALAARRQSAARLVERTPLDLRQAGTSGETRPGALWRAVLALPGNQALRPEANVKEILLPRLPPAWEGFSIAHLADLHYTGRIARDYFEHLVEIATAWQPDLAVVTGDIVEKESCLPWIGHTLARLKARLGCYFVLGNHDKFVDLASLRQALAEAGLVDAGGRWHVVRDGNRTLLLAGNELPWISPAADPHAAPRVPAADPLRLLLAHTPDQVGWARQAEFDLMLAGHTHGGQFCLPRLGPVVAPSRYGVKYAAGTFLEGCTVMHVSRGCASALPLRWNCPPEVTRLILRRRA